MVVGYWGEGLGLTPPLATPRIGSGAFDWIEKGSSPCTQEGNPAILKFSPCRVSCPRSADRCLFQDLAPSFLTHLSWLLSSGPGIIRLAGIPSPNPLFLLPLMEMSFCPFLWFTFIHSFTLNSGIISSMKASLIDPSQIILFCTPMLSSRNFYRSIKHFVYRILSLWVRTSQE